VEFALSLAASSARGSSRLAERTRRRLCRELLSGRRGRRESFGGGFETLASTRAHATRRPFESILRCHGCNIDAAEAKSCPVGKVRHEHPPPPAFGALFGHHVLDRGQSYSPTHPQH
jgi:hypothetical protein